MPKCDVSDIQIGSALGARSAILVGTCIGKTTCIAEVEPLAMSFMIAVRPPFRHDVVFCSEGKELAHLAGHHQITEETTIPVRENFLKTLALNPRLCIAFGGTVSAIRGFLEEFLPDLPWNKCPPNMPPTNFADKVALSQGGFLRDVSVVECCEEAQRVLARLGTAADIKPIVGGEDAGQVLLYHIKPTASGPQVFPAEVAYGVPPGFKPSSAWSSIEDIIEHYILDWDSPLGWSAERRCLRIVELIAEHSFTCNKNVTFRRLSRGFVKEGRDIVND